MAGGEGRGPGKRRPVSTGDSKAVRELLGEGPGAEPADDFALPKGYESRYAQDRRLRAAERQANRETPPPSSGTTTRTSRTSSRSSRTSRTSSRSSRSAATPRRSSRSPGTLGIRRTARAASVVNPTGGKLPIGLTAGAGAAGLFFGAITYALLLSVVDYGPSGPLLWFKAKFLNEAAGAPGSSGSSSSPSSGSSGPVAVAPPGSPYKATAPSASYTPPPGSVTP